MWKACSRCGKIHPYNNPCHKPITYQETQERSLRNKYVWSKKSKEIRERANHLCEVCKAEGRFEYNNLEVHHIIKLKDDASKLLDDDNLICLCQYHHKLADDGKISQDYLRKLAEDRDHR